MPTYKVTGPDGNAVTFQGPAGMSKADVVTRAQQEQKFSKGEIQTTFMGGASKHLLEDEPAARNALLSIPTIPLGGPAAMAAAGAAPWVGSGLKMLSQFLRTGSADAPGSDELIGDAAESTIGMFGGHAIKKGAQLVGAGKEAVASRLPSWLQTIAHASTALNPKALAMDLVTSKPALRAAEEFGEKVKPSNLRDTFSSVINGLKPGSVPDEEIGPVIDRYAPNRSRVSREVAGSSFPESSPSSPSSFPITSEGLKEQPLYQQMEHFPTEPPIGPRIGRPPLDVPSSSSRSAVPPYQVPPAEPITPTAMSPRLAGKAPGLNAELDSILQSLSEPEPPWRVTGAPSEVPMTKVLGNPPKTALDMADSEGRAMAKQFPWDDDPGGIDAALDRVKQRQMGEFSQHVGIDETTGLLPPTSGGMDLPDSWKPFASEGTSSSIPPSLSALESDIPQELSDAIDAAADAERFEGYPNFPPRKMPSFFKGPGTYPKTGKTPAIHSQWEP